MAAAVGGTAAGARCHMVSSANLVQHTAQVDQGVDTGISSVYPGISGLYPGFWACWIAQGVRGMF